MLKTIGTGSGGHYGISADLIDGQGDVESETNGTTTPGQIISNTLTLSITGRSVEIKPEQPADTQPPVITITNPLQNGVYAKTDSVLLTATITDSSPLATTTYWFGSKKINPAHPLPFSTVLTPSIQSVSVSATDINGNAATNTLKFFVVKTKNSCMLDIISILILITQDKTFPNKPTIQNLVADCGALLKGRHHY